MLDLDKYLQELGERGGSDLHLKVGRPPLFRLAGDLVPTAYPELSRAELQETLFQLMGPAVKRRFEENLEVDFSYEVPGLARFRVNVFVQRSDLGAAFRLIPLEVPTIDSLGLPEVLKALASHPNGLVAVTGPTGCGKTTTLAAMIQYINQTRPVHIITIEDPVEFVYTDELATINQRELGIDTYNLHKALRAALRQDPDVILMGEMRDRESMSFAITAAETGHLVLSTLHTIDAKQTLDRILDTFPDQGRQLKMQLALLLRGVVSQKLLRRADGTGMTPAFELLINTPNVRQVIEEGNTRDLEKVMEADSYYGMTTFNRSLLQLVRDGLVTEEEGMAASHSPEDLRLGLRGVTRGAAADEVDLDFARKQPAQPQKKTKFSRGFEF